MLRILSFATASLFLFSCSNQSSKKDLENSIEQIVAEIPAADNYYYDTLSGIYIGDFSGSDIRIKLNYVSSKKAIGYNIHKGLQRNLSGSVNRTGSTIKIELSEPGDHEYDGMFTIIMDTNNTHIAEASWVSNSGNIPPKNFKVEKVHRDIDVSYDELNLNNFSDIFYYLSDSIGDYDFQHDGLVVLSYYNDDSVSLSQLNTLNGTWTLDGNNVTINWQPNSIFPGNILELTAIKSEYDEWYLQGRGEHVLWLMYP